MTGTVSGNQFTGNTWASNAVANAIDFSTFNTTGDLSIGGTADLLLPICLTLASALPQGFPLHGGTMSLLNSCTTMSEKLGPGALVDIVGADDVSFFVTASVTLPGLTPGSQPKPTDVSVKSLLPGEEISSVTPMGTGVTVNDQQLLPPSSVSSNTYSSNSCDPVAPNTSLSLTDYTGGGKPGTHSGGETGYDAC